MKRKDCMMVAWRDIRCKRKFCFQAVRGIFAIVSLLLFSLLIVRSIHLYYKNEVAEYQGYYSVFLWPERDSGSGALTENSRQAMELLAKQPFIESTIYQGELDLPAFERLFNSNGEAQEPESELPEGVHSFNEEFIDTQKVSVECGGKTYCFQEEASSLHSKFRPTLYHADYDIFSKVVTDAELILYGYSPLISGREPKQAGEALLDETFLSHFGLTESDVLEEKLSVMVGGVPLFSGITCVGILRDAYLENVDIFKRLSSYVSACIWLNCDDALFDTLPLRRETVNAIPYDFESVKEINEFVKSNQTYMYSFDAEEAEIFLYVSKVKQLSNVVLFFVIFPILIALSLSLYSTLLEHIRESVNSYGMLSAIGMDVRDKVRIFSYEFLILYLLGFVAALPVGALLFYLTSNVMKNQFASEMQMPLSLLFECLGLVSLFVAALTALITASVLRRYFRLPILEQLRHNG